MTMHKIELEILDAIETRCTNWTYDDENEYLIPDIQTLCLLMNKYWWHDVAYARVVEVDTLMNRYLTRLAN